MTKRAIQAMIMKYAKSFGKPFLTVHKLRHSLPPIITCKMIFTKRRNN